MSRPTSNSDGLDTAVVTERPRPAYFSLPLPDPAETSDVARRWRVVVVAEGETGGPDFLHVPIGETTWAGLPHPLLSGPLDQPGIRPVGTVERIWREPTRPRVDGSQDAVWVWAEGMLDPGERMPEPYARHVLWVDEINETALKLRANAGQICTKLGNAWREQLADEMHCDPTNVGVGPFARHTSGRRPTDTPIGPIVADLRFVDQRAAKLSLNIDGLGWLETAAIPLDNPFATERLARWREQLEVSMAATGRQADPSRTDLADHMRHRLNSLESGGPPDLAV